MSDKADDNSSDLEGGMVGRAVSWMYEGRSCAGKLRRDLDDDVYEGRLYRVV